mgnify:CR=1 FL=1
MGVIGGTAALDAIETNPSRLVIFEIMIRGISGISRMTSIDVLRKVRANEAINDLDVILLSGRARDADVDTGSATGASDCVTEPFSPRELLHRVNAVLARGVR